MDRGQLISEADKFTDEEMKKKYKKKYGAAYDEALKQVDDHIGESLLSLYDLGNTSTLTEVLFMERCLRLLKKGGRMGMVLPEGVLNNKNLQAVREYFEGKAKIILICSIPQDVFIAAGATVKPSLTNLVHTISFSDMNRWEVAYILKEGKLEKVYKSFKYPSYEISQLQKESLFGLSSKASLTQKDGMIPMLRMPNIVNGEIDCSQLKYLPKSSATTANEPDKWLLKKGDFLINRTNSKELVGKSAIFNLDGDYTYASYLIRYRFDTSLVLPEYVNILFMLPLVRKQIDAVSRQTAGQCNINSDEIGAIRIPVPSIPIQQEIIKKYFDAKDGANNYYAKADECKTNALINFEKEIF